MSMQPAGKERWASKIGVILAVSGSAVGLGNFLRFPGQAAAYGGGTFLIPYFISLLVLGIPICWVEWTLGREGGRAGFNSTPGILHHIVKHPVARVFGALGLLIPVGIYMYYVYIEAWCLGYAIEYLRGTVPATGFGDYFGKFVGQEKNGLGAPAVKYLVIVFIINFILIYRGLTRGIESFCKVAMPLLIVAAIVVLIRVLTLPPQPVAEPWHMSLRRALPAARWTALEAEVTSVDGAPLTAVGEAVDEWREAVAKGESGYDADLPVERPAGFMAEPAGLAVTIGLLREPATHDRFAAWVRDGRAKLSDEDKWELIRLESAELMALKDGDEESRGQCQTHRAALLARELTMVPTAAGSDAAATARHAAISVAALDRTVNNGLGFMWNPKSTKPDGGMLATLADPQIWLVAAGQIFFSLSVGFGIIITYASYLRRNDDVVLSGLTATSTNEFCEVCLGGLITIPAAFIFLGAMPLASIPGTFGLGFVTLPAVFEQMPGGRFFGFLWFGMLFAAAITSSLSMLQPAIAFLEEGFGMRRKRSVTMLGLITGLGCLLVVYFSEGLTALNAMDFWVGTFCVYVLAMVLVIVFGWVIGVDRGLGMAHEGAEMRIPRIFRFIIKYVSPAYLLIIFGFWLVQKAPSSVKAAVEDEVTRLTVGFLLVLAVFFGWLVTRAAKRWDATGGPVRAGDPPAAPDAEN